MRGRVFLFPLRFSSLRFFFRFFHIRVRGEFQGCPEICFGGLPWETSGVGRTFAPCDHRIFFGGLSDAHQPVLRR